MPMPSRRLWQPLLSITTATILIGQQILAKTVVAQAQEILYPPYPPVTAATWEGYTKDGFESVFPDAESACNSFKTLFQPPLISPTVEDKKLEYSSNNTEVYQVRCYLKALYTYDNQYRYYEYQSRVNCPIIGLQNGRYIYTGGTNGECRLNQKPPLTLKQKNALNKVSYELYKIRTFIAPLSLACPKIPIPSYRRACSAITIILTASANHVAGKLQKLSIDPPDSNYKIVYQPVFKYLPDLQVESGLSQTDVNAVNALVKNQTQASELANAAYISYNRASTANYAGNKVWEQKQLKAGKQYVQQLANLLDAQPALLTNLVNTLQKSGFPTVTITANDVSSFKSSISTNGLPDSLIQDLKQLGENDNDIELLRQALISELDNTVQGKFPQNLANQSLLNALSETAKELRN